jgi:large subunit ribosomal protein L17
LKGGYTQVLKMGPRRGDGAEMAIVKLVPAPVKEEAAAEEK